MVCTTGTKSRRWPQAVQDDEGGSGLGWVCLGADGVERRLAVNRVDVVRDAMLTTLLAATAGNGPTARRGGRRRPSGRATRRPRGRVAPDGTTLNPAATGICPRQHTAAHSRT